MYQNVIKNTPRFFKKPKVTYGENNHGLSNVILKW